MVDRSAYFAHGTQLKISDGAEPTPTFVDVYGCGSFSGPGRTRDTIDSTSHSSPGAVREWIGGLRDSDELTTDINWLFDDDGQLLLEDAYENQDDPVAFQLVYTFTELNETLSFDAIVTSLTEASPIDDKYTRSLTLKITGLITATNDDD